MVHKATYAMVLAQAVAVPVDDPVARYLQLGGLTAVLLVVLYFYRRDFLNHKETLTQVVSDNTRAMAALNATCERMARAMEASGRRMADHGRLDDSP